MSSRPWYPACTERCDGHPDAGQMLAYMHAVWIVISVEDTPLTDADREVWIDRGMPDLETWRDRPYRISMEWVGGAQPPWAMDGDTRRRGNLSIPAGKYTSWDVYPSGRWPQCSCCGEPMPCRAELEDEQVTAGLDRIAKLEAIPADACWACAEPITKRHKSVTYPGENIDLPGGQPVHFHTRRGCGWKARDYEERWIAVDPRRERILTWPDCEGILIVHADGGSECVSGRDPLGNHRQSQPDCGGHVTHKHRMKQACYVGDDYLRPSGWEDGDCPRGCKPEEHGGCATPRRPERRQPSTGGLFQ